LLPSVHYYNEVLVARHLIATIHVSRARDGTCVSAETARRLACDCGIVHMVEDDTGTTVSVGRKTRSIPASMKRALLKRDTTCRFPGCCNRVFVGNRSYGRARVSRHAHVTAP